MGQGNKRQRPSSYETPLYPFNKDYGETENAKDVAVTHLNMAAVQDLNLFSLPKGFRGRPAWLVQLWWFVQSTAFRLSPQFLYGWRRFLLRLFGASVGRHVLIRPSVDITYPWNLTIGDSSWIGDNVTLYSLGRITIGANCVVSQKSYICTGSHDYRTKTFNIFTKPVVIEDECWIATDVFIAPGVRVHHGAVIGARSTVLHDVDSMAVSAGSPARVIRTRITA